MYGMLHRSASECLANNDSTASPFYECILLSVGDILYSRGSIVHGFGYEVSVQMIPKEVPGHLPSNFQSVRQLITSTSDEERKCELV